MIYIKSPQEVKIMQEGGKITTEALKIAIAAVKPGVRTIDIDKVAFTAITSLGGEPSFMKVDGYKFTTCININSGLVHGLPNEYVIKSGDLVKVDIGTFLKGFHTDLSYTLEVETNKEEKFLTTGKAAINAGINAFLIGNRVGAISNALQVVIEGAGYTVSRELVGHGVGKELHESPYVPGYGKVHDGPEIKQGMVFAIEAIYQKGSPAIKVLSDDWTIVTKDGSLAGLFEKTVAATKEGPLILADY
jgi:methionyl aminopeptidase